MKLGELNAGNGDDFDGKVVEHPLLELAVEHETVDIKVNQSFVPV